MMKHHQGVVELSTCLQVIDEATDVPIHARHLRGVDFHPPLLPLAVLGFFPGRNLLVSGRQLPVRIHYPEFLHAGVALPPQLIPTHCIPPPVMLDIPGQRVQGPVSRRETEVEVERFLVRVFLLEETESMIGDGIGVVIIGIIYLTFINF